MLNYNVNALYDCFFCIISKDFVMIWIWGKKIHLGSAILEPICNPIESVAAQGDAEKDLGFIFKLEINGMQQKAQKTVT